ncbi:putative bifunctional diguanylate cyclase/phosphodiesterase [Rhizobium hainanense]|uniref:Diguanylate cyclase (GGDEF) domain-containing protein n=1 Tax=Rhizobium hainanense TaxID=52131 RepID=A0A1C3VNZ6_9HYPH|nr:EAL domain-containing protein [Rhizobium hainanense]SCB29327.1 diguanylate cyclase (GGDEF) domain-containing protein [Rhizobium hainanense]
MRYLRTALIIVILGFITSAIYISALVFQRQTALQDVGLGNITWTIAQAPSEFTRLEQRVSAMGMNDGSVDAHEVRLRFDIVVNRLKTLRSNGVEKFVQSNPHIGETLDDLEEALNQTRPLLSQLSVPGTPARILAILEPIYPKLARLSSDSNMWYSARIAEDRRGLLGLQLALTWVTVGMLIGGCLLILLLLIHNGLLGRAQKILQAKEQTLAIQNARFDAAMEAMSLGLCLLDDQYRVIVHNPRFLTLFGLDEVRARLGTPLADLIAPELLPPGLSTGGSRGLAGDKTRVRNDIAVLSDHIHHLANGMVLAVSHEPTGEGGWVCTFEDVSERHRAQDRVVHMAHHDALTDMPNRLLFWESVGHALRGLAAGGQLFTILYLDLDRFKEVNDTLGHPVGDVLLRKVARRLRNTASQQDIVARLGGDEFAVLHTCMDSTLDSARDLSERLIASISRPYRIGGNEIVVSTCIGISVAPRTGGDTGQLMKNADLALYQAKADGKGVYRIFSPQMEEDLQNRRNLEADMRHGIKLGQFEVHYQPQISLKTRKIVASEALVRWRHPERGLIPPAEFIPLAEETGFIDALGKWVLQQACQDALNWPEDVRVSVNLSPVQFRQTDLVDTVKTVLELTEFDARRLELEITESVLLQDNAANLEVLNRLRSLGLTIALDDFGTGYSSLNYLQRFPFDKLKIDRSFVRDLENRPDSFAIVQSIATLGRNLKMLTTAEGVETQTQLDLVIKAGCSESQGYYFSPPVPETEFRTMIGRKTSDVGGALNVRSPKPGRDKGLGKAADADSADGQY